MEVRQAGADDVDSVARLRATWHGCEPSIAFLAAFRGWFLREQASRWWWLADDDRTAIGMVNLKLFERMPSPDRAPSRWGYLANLFVVPDRRDRGIGGALVAALVARARTEELVRVVLSPSELSVPCTHSTGFVRLLTC